MIFQKIQEKFGSAILEAREERGHGIVVVKKEAARSLLEFAKQDPECDFDALMDICGVDYLPVSRIPRFEVVYQLYSMRQNHRLRIRVPVPEEDVVLPTVTDLWKSADWFEREAFDMFGIVFEGHPHLKRLLMFEGFEGHPLRKDYPIAKRQMIPVPEEKIS